MPVEVVGVPVDIEGQANSPVVAGSPPVVVAGRPLTNQLTGLASTPTPESPQKGSLSLLVGAVFQAIVPVIILSSYYRGEWAKAYCEETGLARCVPHHATLATVCSRGCRRVQPGCSQAVTVCLPGGRSSSAGSGWAPSSTSSSATSGSGGSTGDASPREARRRCDRTSAQPQ